MRIRKSLLLLSLIGTLFSEPFIVADQQVSAKTVNNKKSQKVRQKHIKAFERVQERFSQGDYGAVIKLLDQLSSREGLNDIELAYIANYRGNICFEEKDLDCAISHFESILERKSNISDNFYNQIVYVLAQLHWKQESYTTAFNYVQQYAEALSEKTSDTYVLLAQSHFKLQNYEEALLNIKSAIGGIDPLGPPIKTTWVYLLIDIYKELDQLEKATEFIDSLDEKNPRTKYRLRVSESYGKIGQNEKMEAIRKALIEQGLANYKDGELIAWQSEGAILPKYRPPTPYPKKAQRRRLEGWVDIMMNIDKSGKPYDIRITDSSTKKIFDASAKQSAQGLRFNPFIKDGEAAEVKDYEIRIDFKL